MYGIFLLCCCRCSIKYIWKKKKKKPSLRSTVVGQRCCLVPFFSVGGNKNEGSIHRTHSHYCWIQNPRGYLGPRLCRKVLWITFIEVVVFRFLHPEAHSKLAYSFVARLCLYVCSRHCSISAAVRLPINIHAFFSCIILECMEAIPTVVIVSRAAVAHVKERSRGFRTTVHSLSVSSWTKALFVVAGFTMDKATECLPTAVWKIRALTKMPFMLRRGHCCSAQADVH